MEHYISFLYIYMKISVIMLKLLQLFCILNNKILFNVSLNFYTNGSINLNDDNIINYVCTRINC